MSYYFKTKGLNSSCRWGGSGVIAISYQPSLGNALG